MALHPMYYFDILDAFHKAKVRYLIVGGLAVNLQGVPRTTNDIDVLIALDDENVKKVKAALSSLGYVPRLPGVSPDDLSNKKKLNEWIEKRNLKVFSFFQPSAQYRHLDILLVHPINFEDAYARKKVIMAGGIELHVINLTDLVEMKKFSGRAQDLSDIEHLSRIINPGKQ